MYRKVIVFIDFRVGSTLKYTQNDEFNVWSVGQLGSIPNQDKDLCDELEFLFCVWL